MNSPSSLDLFDNFDVDDDFSPLGLGLSPNVSDIDVISDFSDPHLSFQQQPIALQVQDFPMTFDDVLPDNTSQGSPSNSQYSRGPTSNKRKRVISGRIKKEDIGYFQGQGQRINTFSEPYSQIKNERVDSSRNFVKLETGKSNDGTVDCGYNGDSMFGYQETGNKNLVPKPKAEYGDESLFSDELKYGTTKNKVSSQDKFSNVPLSAMNQYFANVCENLECLSSLIDQQQNVNNETKRLLYQTRRVLDNISKQVSKKEEFSINVELKHKKRNKRVKCCSVYYDVESKTHFVVFNKPVSIIANINTVYQIPKSMIGGIVWEVENDMGNKTRVDFIINETKRGIYLEAPVTFKKKQNLRSTITMKNGRSFSQLLKVCGFCDAQFRKKIKTTFKSYTAKCSENDLL